MCKYSPPPDVPKETRKKKKKQSTYQPFHLAKMSFDTRANTVAYI